MYPGNESTQKVILGTTQKVRNRAFTLGGSRSTLGRQSPCLTHRRSVLQFRGQLHILKTSSKVPVLSFVQYSPLCWARTRDSMPGSQAVAFLRYRDKMVHVLTHSSPHRLSLALTIRFRLTPASAAFNARSRWTSGGTRTVNLPLNLLEAMGSGGTSPLALISASTSATNRRMPVNASSWLPASQLRLGNSAQRPTYAASSSDHITR